MLSFKEWYEILEEASKGEIKNEIVQIIEQAPKGLFEKFNVKSAQALADKIMQTDPSPNKDFSPSIARWAAGNHIIGLDEHNQDIEKYLELKRTFRKTMGPELARLDRDTYQEVKRILKLPLDFENPSELMDRNDTLKDLLVTPTEKNQGASPELKSLEVYSEGPWTMYRIPPKGEIPGFHPNQVPEFCDARWCVVGRYYGEYKNGPLYPIRKGQQWYAIVLPAILRDNPFEGLRNARNDSILNPNEIESIEPLLEKIPEVKAMGDLWV